MAELETKFNTPEVQKVEKQPKNTKRSRHYIFMLTVQTNEHILKKYDSESVKLRIEKFNNILRRTFDNLSVVKTYLRFKEDEDNNNWDELVKTISLESSVELGEKKQLLHAHIQILVHTMENMMVDIPKLNKLLDDEWGSHLYLYVDKKLNTSENFKMYIRKQQNIKD
jgi:hypothetical protein